MALSRMLKISEFGNSRGLFSSFPSQAKFAKNVRHFRKNKKFEEPKVNPESFATPFQNVSVDASSLTPYRLWKPLGFTILFSATTFGAVAIWEYENMRAHAKSMLKKPIRFFKRRSDQMQDRSSHLVKEVKHWWSTLSQGEKVFIPICIMNVLVFAAWRVPRFQPTMFKYFCSNPSSTSVWPMLLSTFSHYSGFHLLANMYVLHSFSSGAVHSLGKEQFLGLYLTAGVISSFTSYLYKVVTKQPGLSLGASGAIMAILGYVCTQYPDTRLGIILLPIFTFSAGAAIKFIIGLDTVGVLLGWRFFDHAAHLGGAACGIFWALWGNQHIWQKREPVLQYWHELRGSIK